MIYLDLQFLADPSPIPPPPDYFVEDLEDEDCPGDDGDELCGLDVDPHHLVLLQRLEAHGTLSDPVNESRAICPVKQKGILY